MSSDLPKPTPVGTSEPPVKSGDEEVESGLSTVKRELFRPSPTTGKYDGLLLAAKQRTFKSIKEALELRGEPFVPDDFLAKDKDGIPQFAHKDLLRKAHWVLTEMNNSSEGYDIAAIATEKFKKTKFAASTTLLEEIEGNNTALGRAFEPEVWANNIEGLEELYGYLSQSSKEKLGDFEYIKTMALDAGSHGFTVTPELEKSDLFVPDQYGRTAFEYNSTWDQLPEIAGALTDKDQLPNKADMGFELRDGRTVLQRGTAHGSFPLINQMIQAGGEQFDAVELTRRSDPEKEDSVIEILVDTNKSGQVLNIEMWEGRLEELRRLRDRTPPEVKEKMDYSGFVSELDARGIENATPESGYFR